MRAEEVARWICERELIRVKKESGKKPPWTTDPILREYRFCNVHRENDTVTRWIAKHWRPYYAHENFVKATTLARLVNWPPTLSAMGFPKAWDEVQLVAAILEAEGKGKAWGSAYIVSTNGKPVNKALYVVRYVSGMVGYTSAYAPYAGTLEAFHMALKRVNGLGSFMAAQVVADIKNTVGHPLFNASDWWTWAAPGPGSIRGLRRYYNGVMPGEFLPSLQRMASEVSAYLPRKIMPLCMQDYQNVMCEMGKYWRAKDGTGRPKQNYRPNPDFPGGS